MLKDQILRLKKQGYKQATIIKKTGASKSHVSEVLSNKKCRKRVYRITINEYKLVKKWRKNFLGLDTVKG
jgi:predicted transcriptional regulator